MAHQSTRKLLVGDHEFLITFSYERESRNMQRVMLCRILAKKTLIDILWYKQAIAIFLKLSVNNIEETNSLNPKRVTVHMSKKVWRAPRANWKRSCKQVKSTWNAIRSCSNRHDIFEGELLAFILNVLEDVHFIISSSCAAHPSLFTGIISPYSSAGGGHQH